MNSGVLGRLRELLGPENLQETVEQRGLYACDSQRVFQCSPDLVLFPSNTRQVAGIVRLAAEEGIPLTARGAGTGLSGGAVPLSGGWLVVMTRMRDILEIDEAALSVWVQPGVVGGELQEKLAHKRLLFAPDPSSQRVSTIGGNVAENAGGPHCLKIGVTTQHLLGLEFVDDKGAIHRLGTDSPGGDPLDAIGLICGSEGTLGIVTAMQLRLMQLPESVVTLLAPFPDLERACAAVGEILSTGLEPAALEILDSEAIRAVEASVFRAGYPADAKAVLLVEIDGLAPLLADERQTLEASLRSAGALSIESAESEAQRKRLWRGRKGAFGALGRLYRDIYVQDICVPISRLPECIRRIGEIARAESLPVANVFHAGDGNLHPNIGFDRGDPDQLERLHRACEAIMTLAVELGGTLSGEHGIGIEKAAYLPLAIPAGDLLPHTRLKRGLDGADLFNPGKIFPEPEGGRKPGRRLRIVSDGNGAGGREAQPAFFRPESESELALLLTERDGRGKLLMPSGARLLDELPHLPGPVDWILSTASLTGILEHSLEDYYVTARAGTPWEELEDELTAAGRRLDWSVSHPRQRSIGGVAACDESWPLRGGLRSPRDRILGLGGVLATGESFVAGGRVVKNVTGYDLCRLLVGSRGAIAIATWLRFRTRPLPEREELIVLAYDERETALAAARRLLRDFDFPAGLLLASPGLRLGELQPAFHVVCALEGNAATVRLQRERGLDRLRSAKLDPKSDLSELGPRGDIRKALRDFPSPNGRSLYLVEQRASCSKLAEQLPYLGQRWILDLCGRRLRSESGSADGPPEARKEGGGLLTRRAAIGGRGAEAPSRFTGVASPALLERIARTLDPDGRLAPGRWLLD